MGEKDALRIDTDLGAWENLVDGCAAKYVLKIYTEHLLCGGYFFGQDTFF